MTNTDTNTILADAIAIYIHNALSEKRSISPEYISHRSGYSKDAIARQLGKWHKSLELRMTGPNGELDGQTHTTFQGKSYPRR